MHESGHILSVSGDIPAGPLIAGWLRLSGMPLDEAVHASHRYEPAYLAWEIVRRRKNPFFAGGTGFEGYLIGVCHTPAEAQAALLAVGQRIRISIDRLTAGNGGERARLYAVLLGQRYDADALALWSAELGAELGQLRTNLGRTQQADLFRAETYRMVGSQPLIAYQWRDDRHSIGQAYSIPLIGLSAAPRPALAVTPHSPDEADDWQIVREIGRFGHPLLRLFLDHYVR